MVYLHLQNEKILKGVEMVECQKIYTFLCLFSKMAAVSIATVDYIHYVNISTLFFFLMLYVYNMIILPWCEIKKTTHYLSSPL